MQASNFYLQPLDLIRFRFETLILMKTKSCVHFLGTQWLRSSVGVGFLGGPSIILLDEL